MDNQIDLSAGMVPANNSQPQQGNQVDLSAGMVPISQQSTPDGMSDQQLQQIREANDARPWWRKLLGIEPDASTLSPDTQKTIEQNKAALQSRMEAALADDYKAKSDVPVGAAKTIGRDAIGLANLGIEGYDKLTGNDKNLNSLITGKSGHEIDIPDSLQGDGSIGQNLGEVYANVLEFMTGDEALKALTLPEKLQKMAQVTKFLEQHPYMTKIIGTGLRQGAVSGVQTAVKGGDSGDIAQSALVGGTLGGTFEGASGLLEKALANRAAAKGVQEAANEFNVPLSTGQSTTGPITQATEAALKKVPFVNGPFNKLAGVQNDAIKSAADSIADSIASKSASATAQGEGIQNAINEAKNAAGKSYADAQQQISQAGAASLPVPLKGTIADTAQKMLDGIQLPDEFSAGIKDVQGRQGAVDVLKNLAQDTAEDGSPRTMTWEQARRLKSQLFDLANSGESNVGKGALRQMTGALDQSMQDALTGAGKTDLSQQFSQASNHYRAINEAMDTSFVKKLMNRDPIEVGKYLLDNSTPNAVKTMKSLAGTQMPQVQRGIWEEMFNRALNNPDGVVAGKTLQKEFQKLGPETAQAIWSPDQLGKIQRFVDVAGKVGLTAKPASSTLAGVGGGLGTGWMIHNGGLLLGGLKSGGLLLGARGLAKLMTTAGGIDTMTKALTAGSKGANNQAARSALVGLINYAAAQHVNDLKNDQ